MTTIQYLKQYQTAHLERLSLLRRREELRAKYAYPRAIQYSDMPKAHDVNRDLSDFAAKLMELEHLLDSKAVQCLTLETEILCRIKKCLLLPLLVTRIVEKPHYSIS